MGSMQDYLDTPHLLSMKKPIQQTVESHSLLPLGILML